MTLHQSTEVKHATRVLRGDELIKPEQALALAKALARQLRFSFARRVLGRIRGDDIADQGMRVEIAQKRALYTYKDPDLLRGDALAAAWTILCAVEDPDQDVEPDAPPATHPRKETLGIAGAICKRRYELQHDKAHLERALHYYLRGHQSKHPQADYGYAGINAAYVLDALANLEALTDPSAAQGRRERAGEIRDQVLHVLHECAATERDSDWDPTTTWWYHATAAEALLGLHRFDEAATALAQALEANDTPDWEVESTARQISRLMWLHCQAQTDQARDDLEQQFAAALSPFVRKLRPGVVNAETDEQERRQALAIINSLRRGKIGLALSGGGFRASLYHLGVLARLAEHDVLRDVEVLSCVSGGSIVGAYYYLKLRELLIAKPDRGISQDDFIELVDAVAKEFLRGVQQNMRTRIGASMRDNLKMVAGLLSRTERLANLYDECLYNAIGGFTGKRWTMPQLHIKPNGEDGSFHPGHHNWRRLNKVPNLILNATSLNTGHNFQFTASWMGEPPEGVLAQVDSNERLRRLYYHQAPDDDYRHFALARAVAASSCVPALFEPLSLPRLYKRRHSHSNSDFYRVELIDGGVHDNQGTSGLFGADCDLVMVSDASGQSDTQVAPSDAALSVLRRANDVLMKRVRTAQASELDARQSSGLLRGAMYIHLRSDLTPDPEDWLGCDDPWQACDAIHDHQERTAFTGYGILRTIQDKLSNIRTDLDSFSDLEAHALMLSGYVMTAQALEGGVGQLPARPSQHRDWFFKGLQDQMSSTAGAVAQRTRLERMLDVAKLGAAKIWHLDPKLERLALGLKVAAGLVLLLAAAGYWAFGVTLTLQGVALSVLVAVIGSYAGPVVARILQLPGTRWKVLRGVLLATAGWIGTNIHLHWFDPRYLRWGSVENSDNPHKSSAKGKQV